MHGKPTGRKLERTKTPGVYKRGGRYCVIFRDPSGRQVKRSARTLAEARELRAQLQADVARGEWRASSRVTFDAYARDWLAAYGGRTARGIRETTMVGYRRAIEQRAIPYFSRRRLTEIEPRDIKAYAAAVAAGGASASTVRNALAPVRALFADAVEEGLLRHNPAAGIRLPRAAAEAADGEPAAKALTDAELARLLAAAAPEWQLLFRFLADTGLRIGEALALTWGHVDFGARRVKVRRRIYAGEYAPPKSAYGRRDVPISAGLAQALWERRKSAHGADDAPVWPRRGGRPVDASTAYRAVKAAARAAGVPGAGLHTLRHTCATRLFRNGANAKQVQHWLGHHSPAFTLATYVHLLPDDLPDPAFMDALGGGNKGATSRADAALKPVPAEVAATA
jgi:integrase